MIDHSSFMSSELSLQIFYLLYFKLIHLIRFNIIFLQFHGEDSHSLIIMKSLDSIVHVYSLQ